MKKLLILSLIILVGVTGFAKTNYFENIYIGGTTTAIGSFTMTGGIDSSGICDFQFSPLAGSSNGHILKSTFTAATAYSGTSAGLQVKSYFASTGTTITGGEFTGVYVNVKQLATMTGGAKSSIISGHNYGTGGDYQSLDYGAILYGDLTWGFVLSGGTSTYGLYFGDQTISTADIYLQNGETIDNATDGFINAQAPITSYAQSTVLNDRHRVTVAEINAGHELLPAITGRAYRIISVTAIAYGGAVGTTTTVDILGTQGTSSVKLVAFAQASLTQSTVLNAGDAGAAVLADGASFAVCDAASAITISKTGGDADTATGVDIIITYVIE